jgi:uncharacterized protein (UPF0262 family)
MPDRRIVNITLDQGTGTRRHPDVEQERAVAMFDLLEENFFAPTGDLTGPYSVNLRLHDNRLHIEIRNSDDSQTLRTVQLPLVVFRRIVKDYFTVCESYFEAIKTASPSRIEAIDMGRRGLHNEGADLLRERLEGEVEIDENTARRLFTLICVLHFKG